MKRLAAFSALLYGLLGTVQARAAEPVWSGNNALTIPARRVELGLLGSSHYGFGPRCQVSLHPLWFFALPHVELKLRLSRFEPRYYSAVRMRLAYPTLFLGLVSAEGAGGLLPKTSSPPQALQMEADYLATAAFGRIFRDGIRHMATASLGLAVAPHTSFSPSELPLLDFPFLYPRFAALYTWVVPRGSLTFEGSLFGKLFYEASTTYYLLPSLPDVGTAYALEPALSLEYRFSGHVAASLALRGSLAEYAYGTRFHWLPYADVRVGF